MKLLSAKMGSSGTGAARPANSAFTVVEIVTVAAIMTVVVIALVAMQIFALRIYTLAATKTTATQNGRVALDKMRIDIRSANTTQVGTYAPGSGVFAQISNGLPQIGNALQLGYLDTNYNVTIFITYYLDNTHPTNQMCRIDENSNLDVLVQYVTNYYVFDAEDYQGNMLSNSVAYLNNGVIHVVMQFDQWEYPVGFVGTNAINAYDFYYLTTRITRRCKQ